jgi:hypothetical protein
MGDFTIIGVVGEILQALLRLRLASSFGGSFSSVDSVTLLSPKDLEGETSHRLSVFLYQVTENAYMKNQPMQSIGGDQLKYSPLSLSLYYLLTPYAEETIDIRGWDTHTILGRAMQVLYDNATLEGPALMDILQEIGRTDYYDGMQQIRIILHPLSLDDMTKIWNSLDTTLRLSVCYEIRVIMIESEREKDVGRITEKDTHYSQKA